MPSDLSKEWAGMEDLSDLQIKQLLSEAEGRLNSFYPAATQDGINLPTNIGRAVVTSFPKLDAGEIPSSYVHSHNDVAHVDSASLLGDRDRELSGKPRQVEDPALAKERIKQEKKATAGSQWFNLPRTNLTPELKRDLQLLHMRSVLDPKRHYKKENGKTRAPEYSHIGTIVEGPTEFYSARLLNKDRKKTFVDEVLAGEEASGRFKSKYNDIQSAKTSGKNAYYKELKARRSQGIKKS
ncbi:MAG: hypothetical protein M1819_001314 [Sarea resinae]|nr:MAG: hypothetical protein M1819_001314 [Sarea resinae]